MKEQEFNAEIKRVVEAASFAFKNMDKQEYNDFYGDYENHSFESACANCANPDVARLGGILLDLMELSYDLPTPEYEDED